jgi:hypothetical protein
MALDFKYLGRIAPDEQLDNYALNGRLLFDLPSDKAAHVSARCHEGDGLRTTTDLKGRLEYG